MKALVSYFSASGETRQVAAKLKEILSSDLEEIIPKVLYTDFDLDWRSKHSRSTIEMGDESSRPGILPNRMNPENYDVLFIGYPIWWGVEPRVIDTYLDKYDLGKIKIVPFATSGGSPISGSVEHLRKLYPSADIEDGILLNFGVDEALIRRYKR